MAYTINIPGANDIPAQSQPLMRDNFNDIAVALAVDHVGFNNAAQGQHAKISFSGAGIAPATLFGLYATGAAMFLRNNGTNINITGRGFTLDTNGYTYLPSGLLIKFGLGTTVLAGGIYSLQVDMHAIGAHYSQRPFLQITPLAETGGGTLNRYALLMPLYTAQYFTIQSYDGAGATAVATFSWMAIGTV